MSNTHAVQTLWIDLAKVDLLPDSREHDPEKLATLAQDMKEQGQLQEIIVTPVGERYQVIAGAGRATASRKLGWTQIRASVRPDVSDFDKARITFAENEDREDADPFYQAAQLAKMLKAKGCTQQVLAKELGISDSLISAYSGINALPDVVKENSKRLELGQLIQVCRLKIDKDRIDLAKKTLDQELSVRQVKALVDGLLGNKKAKHSALGAQHSGLREKQPDVQWRGEEIVINRHFRPVTESLAEYVDWLTRTVKPMLLAMPGLKDSPKGEKALAKAQEQVAAQANAEAQKQVDESLAKMSPEQIEAFAKQVEEANAQDERENAVEHERVQKLLAEEEAMYSK